MPTLLATISAVVALAVGAAPVSRDGAAAAVAPATSPAPAADNAGSAAAGGPAAEGERGRNEPPATGLTGGCAITEVYDGDTLTVEFTLRARVRLLDCWADEVRTTDEAAKARGLAARDHLGRLCGLEWDGRRWTGRTPATLHAPFGDGGTLGNLFTLERLLARVWVARGELSALQRAAGHAAATKEELVERNPQTRGDK